MIPKGICPNDHKAYLILAGHMENYYYCKTCERYYPKEMMKMRLV